jgi:hypothetical protein
MSIIAHPFLRISSFRRLSFSFYRPKSESRILPDRFTACTGSNAKETTVTFSRIWSVSSLRPSHAYGAVEPEVFFAKKKETPVVLQPSYNHYLPEAEFFSEFYSTQEKRKVEERLSIFFSKSCTESGKN